MARHTFLLPAPPTPREDTCFTQYDNPTHNWLTHATYCYQDDYSLFAVPLSFYQMAPVLMHPSHSHLISRSPWETRAAPIKVTKYIGIKVFLQLFAGTVIIFIVAVLFWKLGKFCRFLTRNKVLRKGNTTTTRYARTWYGWVSAGRHEQNKALIRKYFKKICGWATWTSSNNDYRWAWWDPGQKELNRFRKGRRPLRWMPTWVKSYSYIAADTIWNPGPPHHGGNTMSNLSRRSASLTAMTGALSANHTLERARRQMDYLSRMSIATSLSIQLYLQHDCRQQSIRKNRIRSHQDNFARKSNFERSRLYFLSSGSTGLYQSYCSVRANVSCSDLADRGSIIAHSLSLPCLFSQHTKFRGSSSFLDSLQTTNTVAIHSRSSQKLEISRKYQVWSTWMELQQPEYTKLLRPPPGTPRTELLASTSSDQLPITPLIKQTWNGATGSSSADSTKLIVLDPSKRGHVEKGGPAGNPIPSFGPKTRSSAAYLRSQLRLQYHSMASNPYDQALSLSRGGLARQKKLLRMRRSDKKEIRKDKDRKLTRPLTAKVSIQELSNWEIQFIDGLDRKLEWLYNQLSPGRRPYHFAMLANHWLNKETWIVIDPPTRVSIDARRQLGDPRFNVPYLNTDWTPKPKYPKVRHKAVYTPRIDSWRAAVNRNRQVSGLHNIVQAFQLYDDPADNPPDGKVDPSCWILRKPPQGFHMSTRQKQVYYEGGAGWQETLDDWQKVRRGYRIQKAIHEGRVNRTRAREIALGISRYYRMVAAKDP